MAVSIAGQDKGHKIYIGGLLENVIKDELLRELNKYGEVVDLWIARNPPGFAFVEYSKSSDAEKAVRALDGVTVCGSRVRVEFAHGGRTKKGPGFRGARASGRGPPRRYDSPPRRNGRNSSPYEGSRYSSYDRFASFYPPEVANAAAAAAAVAGFPYGMTGYPPMLPFISSEEFFRSFQSRRRSSPGRIPPPLTQRGRSPVSRRRSRSPLGPPGNKFRGRSPPITYDGRGVGRRHEIRGRGGFGEFSRPRVPRSGHATYSPPLTEINGRRTESRGRLGRDDRRRR